MDDVNRFARELADAIAAAVAEHPKVEACRERARAAGYEMKVTLEAVVGFVSRDKAAAATKEKSATRRADDARAGFRGHVQRPTLPAFPPHRRGRDTEEVN